MKTYKIEVKIIKNNINEHISAQKHHQTTIVAFFISSVIQFDKFFHSVVLYENYQISFEENFVSHSEGPTEQFGMNSKGPRSAGYIVP